MENEDRLTIGDYLTLPIVDLVQDPDFDIGFFAQIASLSNIVPSMMTEEERKAFFRMAHGFGRARR